MKLMEAIKKIDKIRSEIDGAFEKGSIDFDSVDADLENIKGELESMRRSFSRSPDEGKTTAVSNDPSKQMTAAEAVRIDEFQ